MMSTIVGSKLSLNPPVKFGNKLYTVPDDLPLAEIKYMRWDKAYELLPESVKPVLDDMFNMMPDDKDMKWVVDYKVRDLKVGDCGCALPNIHLDCITDPWHDSKPETHFVFSTVVGTWFVQTPIEVLPEERHFNDVVKRTEDWCMKYVSANPNTITKYGRHNLHAGPIVTEDCRRVLLRLTQTEVI